MEDYKKEKRDIEDFINGTVKKFSPANKEKALWLIQGMLIGQSPVEVKTHTNISKKNQV